MARNDRGLVYAKKTKSKKIFGKNHKNSSVDNL